VHAPHTGDSAANAYIIHRLHVVVFC
jgi:hypothetical protein